MPLVVVVRTQRQLPVDLFVEKLGIVMILPLAVFVQVAPTRMGRPLYVSDLAKVFWT